MHYFPHSSTLLNPQSPEVNDSQTFLSEPRIETRDSSDNWFKDAKCLTSYFQ